MSQGEVFDLLILGAGQASVPLATDLSEVGWRVAVAEREHLGGSCVNFGCIPTKAVLESAKLAHQARRARDYGLEIPEMRVDFEGVLAGAEALIEASRKSLQNHFKGPYTPTLLRGEAFIEAKTERGFRVRVGDERVEAERLVISTGTRSVVPDLDGLDEVAFLNAHTWLTQRSLPEHLIVLGAGPIGLELSQFYRRMGARVTVVEAGAQIAMHEDEDVAERLQSCLEAEDIAFFLNAKAKRVEERGDGLSLTFEHEDAERTISGSHLLVAVGRKPNTDDLGLEDLGVTLDDDGMIEVDEHLATSAEGIWVAGDVRGGPMFTHAAYDDYRILKSQLLEDGEKTLERVVPYAVFTDPQLGRVGMTEREARKAGKSLRVAHYAMKVNGRARAARHKEGCIKVVIDKDTDLLLGAAVLAAEGAEMVHAYIALMNAGAPYTAILNSLHIHPTYSEGLLSVFKGLE